MTSEYSDIGGLIGCVGNSSSHSISKCSVVSDNTGLIKGDSEIGGLIGRFYGINSVEESYTKVIINGRNYIGGLIGWAENVDSNISNCFSVASISIINSNYSGSAGGLIGDCSSSVSSCYASGTIFLNTPKGSTAGVIASRINEGTNMNNNFSRVTISVGESYVCLDSSSYDPNNQTPLWFEGYSSYSYNASGTNYVSEGYKESLNWDSNVWNNLTEGALPTLKN